MTDLRHQTVMFFRRNHMRYGVDGFCKRLGLLRSPRRSRFHRAEEKWRIAKKIGIGSLGARQLKACHRMSADKRNTEALGFSAYRYFRASHIQDELVVFSGLIEEFEDVADGSS